MPLFRFILVLIVFYLIARIFFRYIFPWLMRKWINKIQNKYSGQTNTHKDKESKRKEGEIHIDNTPTSSDNSPQKKDDDKDYVDYEEL